MDTGLLVSAGTNTRFYEAVLRISEVFSASRGPEELARTLSDNLAEFLSFDHLDFIVFKENSNEIEWHGWGKGPLPRPDFLLEELPSWIVYNTQIPLHIADWKLDVRFPQLKQWTSKVGLEMGSVVRVPLTTPHRRLGSFGIVSDLPASYSADDIDLLRLIARVVAFALDDGFNLKRAQTQNDRLQLLLNFTRGINSNLEFRDLMRTISVNIREVMNCDLAAIALPGPEPGTSRVYALDFPGGKGFVKEEHVYALGPDHPATRALNTLKPVISGVGDAGDYGARSAIAVAEGIRGLCCIPLVNRGHALGTLTIARVAEGSFTPEDVDFLRQAAGQIAIAIENALAYKEISQLKDKLAQEKLYLEEEIRREINCENLVGRSAPLKHVLQLVETVAPNDSTVLLLGETGTGKELVARAIHERSRRKDRTFVKLNCAAIPSGLLESELFGHEKGAFTGAIAQKVGRLELADQGTLFLDEVGDIPADVQPKLLRALQEREFERLGSTVTRRVNLRLIAATNCDLERMVANREFRSDLFYRLNVFPIRIPPLRHRREDIPLLVSYFVQKFAKQMQKRIENISATMMKGLIAWEWPGNVRELENFIERAVILTRGSSLEAPLAELRKVSADWVPPAAAHLEREDIARIVKETVAALNARRTVLDEHSERQRQEIVRALTESKGRVGGADGAAARMRINRTTLISRMKRFGIDPRQYA